MAVFAPFLDVAFDLLSDTPGAPNQAGFVEVMAPCAIRGRFVIIL
jgi:hypothetical protein